MYIILSLLPILFISIAIAQLLGRRLTETFPFTLFGVIALVYLFGLIGALEFSKLFISFLGLLSLVLLVLRFKHVRELFNIETLIVLTGTFLIVAFAAGRKVTDMDAFEQWAYIVKRMSITNSLLAAQGQYATTALYPPGMALLQYLMESFSPIFSESALFVGQNIFTFALLLPLLGRVDRSNWKLLIFLIPVLVFLPFTEYVTFDSSLEVDPVLGLLFGYLVLYGITARRLDWFYYGNLILGSFALSLIKMTGFLFCVFAALIILFLRLQMRASDVNMDLSNQKPVRWLLPSLCVVAAALFGTVSWTLYVKLSGAEIAQSSAFSIAGGLAQYQKETIVSFLTAAFASEGGAGLNSLSPVSWLFAVPLITAIAVRLLTQDVRLRQRSMLGALLLSFGYFAWVFCLLVGYLTSFVEGEAMALAGFSRYLSSYQIGGLLICVVWIIEAIRMKQLRESYTYLALVVCALALLMPAQSVFNATIGSPYANRKTVEWRMRYDCNRYYDNLDVDSAKICYLDQNETEPGYSFAMFQFEALPYDVEKAIAWRFGGPYYEEDYYSLSPSAAEWEAALVDGGFTHLYLRNVNDYFLENYATLFENLNCIQANAYYEINIEGNHVQFVYIDS